MSKGSKIPTLPWPNIVPAHFLCIWKEYLHCIKGDQSRQNRRDELVERFLPLFHSPNVRLPILIPTLCNFIQLAFLSFSTFATFRAFSAFGTLLVPHVGLHKSLFSFLTTFSFSILFWTSRTILTNMPKFTTTKTLQPANVHSARPSTMLSTTTLCTTVSSHCVDVPITVKGVIFHTPTVPLSRERSFTFFPLTSKSLNNSSHLIAAFLYASNVSALLW